MTDKVAAIIDELIKREGGYSDHPSDAGGPTRYGVTERVARAFGYTKDMKTFPLDLARRVYLERFWLKPGFGKVNDVDDEVAFELFDTGVNMGPGIPSLWFQRWLNGFNRKQLDYPDLTVDAQIGDVTVQAFRKFIGVRGADGRLVMLGALNSSQGARYLDLAEGRPANEDFLYGWILQRVVR